MHLAIVPSPRIAFALDLHVEQLLLGLYDHIPEHGLKRDGERNLEISKGVRERSCEV